jgi:hypothetical protein
MNSFEDVRAHLGAQYTLHDSDPYLISLDLAVGEGRRQSLFLAELEGHNERRYLRISSPIAPLGKLSPAKCLRFNWEQRVGYLALSDLDGVPYLQLCENRPYGGLSERELDSTLVELGTLADSLEHLLRDGGDVV